MKHTLLLASVLLAFIACSDKELEEKERLAQSAVRGKVLFEQCVVCHGERAEKSYMEEVPPIKLIDYGMRAQMMKSYRDGTLGKKGIYGLADLKGEVMLRLSDEDMADIDEYIESMKLADEATKENTKKIQ